MSLTGAGGTIDLFFFFLRILFVSGGIDHKKAGNIAISLQALCRVYCEDKMELSAQCPGRGRPRSG